MPPVNNNPLAKPWIIAAVVLSIVLVGAGAYFVKSGKLPDTFAPSQNAVTTAVQKEEAGVEETRKSFRDYPGLVKRAFIQQTIEGTLKAFTANSWTVEVEGKSLTLTHEGQNKIRYTRLSKPKTQPSATTSSQVVSPVEIKAEELKVGDKVSVTRTLDWQTGKETIIGVMITF